MERQRTHADWTILPRGHYPKRPDVHLGTEIELTSSFIEFLLDGPAFMFMLLTMFVLTLLVAVPDALAPVALLQGITLLSARRAQLLGCRDGPSFRGGFAGIIIILFRR